MLRPLFLPLLVAAGLLTSCGVSPKPPDLASLYAAAASAKGEARRPLIGVPGTLGSRLVDGATGRIVWGGGASGGISADPDDPDEFSLLALPIPGPDQALRDIRDTVVPDGILDFAIADVLGVSVEIEVYGGVLPTLSAGGFRYARPEETVGPDFNTFRYDYDWRRDLIETAQEFGAFVRARREEVATRRGVAPETVRFDLLAHSMGGLVSRYFLMYGDAVPEPGGRLPPITWAGAAYFERVVFVAPPNAGSIVALENLVNGKTLGPLQPFYPPHLLATHPSVYQLMPRARHNRVVLRGEPVEDLYSGDRWAEHGWGLAGASDEELALLLPDEQDPARRRLFATEHTNRLLARARTFHRMMDRWAPPPPHLDMFLVVGGGFETPATGAIDPATGRLEITEFDEGDGVVLRASALLDERQGGDLTPGLRSPLEFKSVLLLPDEHVELTKNPIFGDNFLFWLLEAPRSARRLQQPANADMFLAKAEEPEEEARKGPPEPNNDR